MAKINGFYNEYNGLTDKEVNDRLTKYGNNELAKDKKYNIFLKILKVLSEPMFLLLIISAIIYMILGEPKDAIIMFVAIFFVITIEFIQEYRTDKTLKALRELSAPVVTVFRNNNIVTIESRDLVVDDLMIIEEGEKIAADGKILEIFDLGVDESMLTGESDVVIKSTSESGEGQFLKNMVYTGTLVTGGTALVRVTATAYNTEYGKIGLDVQNAPDEKTPLEKQINKLVKYAAILSLNLLLIVFVVTYFRTGSFIDATLSGVTLAMGIIPEEFPVILTVFLSMGAYRLAKRQSIIRKLPAVQTLGTISVLCVDKTGTLTKNEMQVEDTYVNSDLDTFLKTSVLACEISPFDPMEKAIIRYFDDKKDNREELYKNKLVFEYAFSSINKNMAHIWQIGNKKEIYAKGSPESILKLCKLDEIESEKVKLKLEEMSVKGLRVIAIAKSEADSNYKDNLSEYSLDLVGLLGFRDPPRDGVVEAIEKCHQAGIKVMMITGDSKMTASAIAKQIGIITDTDDLVITGDDLDQMNEEELNDCIENVSVFARVAPKHKMQIVKALKNNGKIVAMTGDGVNDAPALKYADIGISMGKRGTSVAREASSMILLDDNFSTIVNTIEDGRKIYDNIRKAIGYVLTIHIPIAFIAMLAPIMDVPLMLLPIHIVLLELVIDPVCSIVFERQPAENNILKQKPRNPKESIVNSGILVKSILQGVVIFAAVYGSYIMSLGLGSVELARSFAIVVLLLSNIFLIQVNMSNSEYAIKSLKTIYKDKVILITELIIINAMLLIVYSPFFNNIVVTAPLDLRGLILAILVSFVSVYWWEIVKLFKNSFMKGR